MTPPTYPREPAGSGGLFSGTRAKGWPLIDTQSAISGLPRQVAGILLGMTDLKMLWRERLAPVLKRQKDTLGRAVSERQIAHEVALATGQDSSRSLLSMWLRGELEPTVSQFVALCRRLMLDPVEILATRGYAQAPSALAHTPARKFVKSGNIRDVPQGKTRAKHRAKAHKVTQRG